MNDMKWPMNLFLFDGEGGAETGGEAALPTAPAKYRNVNRVVTNVASEPAEEAASQPDPVGDEAQEAQDNPTEPTKKASFDDLIKGDYKDDFQARVDKVVNARFAKERAAQEQHAKFTETVSPLLTTLAARYGKEVDDIKGISDALESDNAYFASKAEEMGISVDDYRRQVDMQKQMVSYQQMQQQMRKMQADQERQQRIAEIHGKWARETEETQKLYPSFDFDAENQSEDFRKLLEAGVSVKAAYEVVHKDELLSGAIGYAVAETKKRTAKDIAARGNRPMENGASGQAAQVSAFDYDKLSRRAKDEMEKRAMRGEKVNPIDFMNYG